MTSTLRRSLDWLIARVFPASYRWPAQDIQLADRRLHLVGSIHMGTRDMQPLPAALLQQLQKADALIVEADITQGASPFDGISEREPLHTRLPSALLERLDTLCTELHIALATFDRLPAWQIALILQSQQARQLGLRADYGIDLQLIQAAKAAGKPVIELEGAAAQVSLLTSLPEDGRDLLEDTLIHWHTNAQLLQMMISWWLRAPQQQSDMTLPTTFSAGLNQHLILQRNLQWCEQFRRLPAGRYVVAVGALHLYGEGNLAELLRG